MRYSWTTAVLLTAALTAACGDRGTDNTQNFEENTVPPAATAPAADQPVTEPAAPSRADDSTVRNNRPATGTRPTTGTREPAPAAARPAPAAPARTETAEASTPPAPRFREVAVPAGTALPLSLLTPISSETAELETPVRARVRQAVVVDGYTALPAGAILHGNVTDVDRAGRVRGRARLAFRFTEVELDGGRDDLRTNPIAFEGEATKGEDATKVGAGAVGGAIIGGILGGKDGAAKGAAVGGAAGTGVVLATRGREVTLGAGTDIAATLAEPFTIRAQVR